MKKEIRKPSGTVIKNKHKMKTQVFKLIICIAIAIKIPAQTISKATKQNDIAHTSVCKTHSEKLSFGNNSDSKLFQTNSAPGEALSFDGVNDYIVDPIPVSSFTNGVFTIEAWVKSNSIASYNTIVKNWGKALYGVFHLGTTLVGNQFEIYIAQSNSVTVFATDPATITLGTWYHVAAVADGTNLKLYKNGAQVASSPYDGTLLTNFPYTFIGAKPNDTGTGPAFPEAGYWSGTMDELRIWNRALCQAEIQNSMNGEITSSATGLIANYHFNQGVASASNPSVTNLMDASGNNIIGALTNFTLTGSTGNWVAPGAVVSGSVVPAFINPTVAISGVNSICNGTSTTFTASGNVSTYTWTSGPNSSLYTVSPSVTTTYSVIGTNAGGCSSNVAIITLTVNPLPTVSVNSGTICSGDSFTIVPSGASSYTITGGSSVVTPTSNISYNVIGSSSMGCISSNTAISSVTVNALPVISVVSSQSLLCVGQSATISANGANTYLWNTSATTSVITVSPTITTTYSVTGTDVNGCINTTTIAQLVSACTDIFSIRGIDDSGINIYPNPAVKEITIEVSKTLNVKIVNALGQIVNEIKLIEGKNSLNLTDLNFGIYYFIIEQDNSRMTKKIVIDK